MDLFEDVLELTYDNGMVLRAKCAPGQLTWRQVAGPQPGSTGVESATFAEVDGDTWFANWVESSGTTVSLVLDLGNGRVDGLITWRAKQGRANAVLTGSVTAVDSLGEG